MLDFGYLYDEYRPYILGWAGLFAWACLALSLFIYITKDDVATRLELSNSDTHVVFKVEKQVEEVSRDLFFQAGVYPNSYELECESENTIICDSVSAYSWKIQHISLWGHGANFSEDADYSLDIAEFFQSSVDGESYLSRIFSDVVSQNTISSAALKSIKQESQSVEDAMSQDEVYYSDMEALCFQGIEDSQPVGSEENISQISQRFHEECSGLEKINGMQVVYNDFWLQNNESEDQQDQEIAVKLSISKVEVRYDLFERVDGEYVKYDARHVTLPYEASFEFTTELSSIQ